jgi:hypothetical protein
VFVQEVIEAMLTEPWSIEKSLPDTAVGLETFEE